MRPEVMAFGRWFALFLLLWLIISGANGWGFGIAGAAGAALLALWLPLPWPSLRLSRLPSCTGFFLQQLFAGGWDVARRALHPARPINPAWTTYTLQSDNPRVHQLLSALIGLMPGTLASHYSGSELYVHALDQDRDWQTATRRFEQLLDQLLGTTHP